MKISVIIPTYNRRHTLGRALNSVLQQSHCPDEVIVVDDGSTDHTDLWLKHNYPDVRVIRQENLGVSAARNTGIRQAKGDWIALLDSDDEWLVRKLKLQCDALNHDDNADRFPICHSDEIWIRNGLRVNQMKKHRKYGGWIFKHCLPLCAISPSSVLIKRDLLDDVGMFDESLAVCEDYDFWLRACSRVPVLYVDQKLLKKYGGHSDQLSRKHWGMDRFRVMALEKVLCKTKLSTDEKQATQSILHQKLSILVNGARKRGNTDSSSHYEEKLNKLLDTIGRGGDLPDSLTNPLNHPYSDKRGLAFPC